ncbi:MAG: PilT/PilU family type 4a pilus ATPase [Thiobacillaceae bacterium]|jgi:twitching motility protein PilU|nr:PilT/PilU family type 4a pilus ATPase [Thiobacillaceae bacterium]
MQIDSPYFKYVVELLKVMLEKGGSDLFITVGAPPAIKIHGDMTPFGGKPVSREQAEEIVAAVMNDKQRDEFRDTKECNFALSLDGIGRFRVNAYVQRGSHGLVARVINTTIPTVEGLKLPPVLKEVVMEKRGLLLMVGGTGSGKSTSLAAMLDHRNEHSKGHIITIEDPVEFVHQHKRCLIMQREVGVDTDNWHAALKNTLRQAPDVILIGEIRDRDTMDYAIAFAETGHLCLATLHANNANQALDRIINFFPADRRQQILMDLSLNLKAVVSQRLIPAVGGGRAAAVEIMLNTPRVADLILKGQVHEIKEAMAKSKDLGMRTFDQALFELCQAGRVEPETALRYADSYNELRLMLKNMVRRAPLEAEAEVGEADDNGLSLV